MGRGRTVNEWKLRPERNDNHWLDCLAGCAVCGSMLGATMPEFGVATTKKHSPTTMGRLSDLRKMRKSGEIPSFTPESGMKLSDLQKNRKKVQKTWH